MLQLARFDWICFHFTLSPPLQIYIVLLDLLLAPKMAAIGSLLFCTDCGNLLRESTGNADAILHCVVCGAQNKGESLLYSLDFIC
jgi:hypothetical protein